MVLARGTFGAAVLHLSPHKTVFYAMLVRQWDGPGKHLECIPTTRYTTMVMKYWTNNIKQRQLMMVERCKEWRIYSG
jgi:hypothetical protein